MHGLKTTSHGPSDTRFNRLSTTALGVEMSENQLPIVGDWYKNEAGDTFEVVAIDEEQGYAEIQYFDGSIEELDLDTWAETIFESVEPPEDWSGSLDIEREDYGVDLEENGHLEWNNPLDEFER